MQVLFNPARKIMKEDLSDLPPPFTKKNMLTKCLINFFSAIPLKFHKIMKCSEISSILCFSHYIPNNKLGLLVTSRHLRFTAYVNNLKLVSWFFALHNVN